ncbi:hypothetical protein HOV03_gp92 [Gordonia phage Asapag]|uniref:Uncharacterized protein n=1 Tax=Gordonia phage Asapag TaxID=2507862 RepID=A0A410TE00_9CAUD|nr:hypothetical protein HOV03_gp92 [Gordonia phage Asapag]QAU07231.1 hypothetical protein SEA_ASAPAG_92 [Gordonia phage Asapag]
MTSRIVNRVPLLRTPPQRSAEEVELYMSNMQAILDALNPDQSIIRSQPSEPVLIGKTWKARLRDWGELAVMGIFSALILLLGTTLGLLIYSLIREIA